MAKWNRCCMGAAFSWKEKGGRKRRRDVHGGGSGVVGASMTDKKVRGEVGGKTSDLHGARGEEVFAAVFVEQQQVEEVA